MGKFVAYKRQKGFTIVEMMIYMGLLTLFLYVLTEIFISVTNLQLESQTTSSVQQDGRYILARLSYDIKQSQDNYNPVSATTPTPAIITPAAVGGYADRLVLTVGGTQYTYSLSGGNLVVTDSVGTDQINGYDTTITNIGTTPIFYRLGNPTPGAKNSISINYKVTSRSKRPGVGAEIKTYSTTVSTR